MAAKLAAGPQCARLLIVLLVCAQLCLHATGQFLEFLDGNIQRAPIPKTGFVGGLPVTQHDSSPQPLDMITARGFIGESFTARSRDGAPITLYHLINPLANQQTLNKYPVLVFHGLSGDASQLMSNSDLSRPRKPIIGQVTYEEGDRSVPFMLANNNFDVYLLDARGTNLNNHLISSDLNPIEANKFWNYTLDEQAQLDLPTAIEFVLEQTKQDKLHFVGYSESTFFMLALLAAQPEYQARLASMVLIAPVAYLTHIKGSLMPLLVGASLAPDQVNGNYLPQPVSDTLGAGLRYMCSQRLAGLTVCRMWANSLSGATGASDDPTSLFQTGFKSTSIKALKHFYQLHIQKRFGMYDYGPEGNMRQYGQPFAPNYNLANIRLPTIILVRGGEDFLSTPQDQEILLSKLGTRPLLDINLPTYNHLDFFIAKKSLIEVNVPVVRTMLDILKSNAQAEASSMLRNAELTPKRYKPDSVRLPDGSRHIEVKSNLLPNLLDGIAQSKTSATRQIQAATSMGNPLHLLNGITQQMPNVFNLPILGLG